MAATRTRSVRLNCEALDSRDLMSANPLMAAPHLGAAAHFRVAHHHHHHRPPVTHHSHADHRVSWRHSTGHFEMTNEGEWVEVSPSGHHYEFSEQYRTRSFVQLYDSSRDCHVRLYAHHCLVEFGGGGYVDYYSGSWANT